MKPAGPAHRFGRPDRHAERGQAFVEAMFMTLPLVLLIMSLLQIFLIDQHVFRLATASHQRFFAQIAFPNNNPGVPYSTDQEAAWDGPDQYVPVFTVFRLFGGVGTLVSGTLRIRSVRPSFFAGPKRIAIGRGTAPSIMAGLQGLASPGAILSVLGGGMAGLARAVNVRNQAGTGPRP